MLNYEVKENKQYNSIELYFNEKPGAKERDAMKAAKMKWNPKKCCWYGFIDVSEVENMLKGEKVAPAKKESNNFLFDVKVGDIFYTSWGYEQTNVNFFQVIALSGKQSVRVVEVYPDLLEEKPTSSMSSDRIYKIPDKLLKPDEKSFFINDSKNGDLKRLKSYAADKKNDPIFEVGRGGYTCHKYTGGAVYVSWYY